MPVDQGFLRREPTLRRDDFEQVSEMKIRKSALASQGAGREKTNVRR
jgi:hypothetical protein